MWFRFPTGEGCVVVVHHGEAHEDEQEGNRRVRKVDLGEIALDLTSGGGPEEGRVIKEVKADLQWDKGETVVFCGFLRCFRVGFVEVCLSFLSVSHILTFLLM